MKPPKTSRVPVETSPRPKWHGIPKGQRGIDELNIWLRQARWELSVEHNETRRGLLHSYALEIEKEIERREGK